MRKVMEGPWLLDRQSTLLVTSPKRIQERGWVKVGLIELIGRPSGVHEHP